MKHLLFQPLQLRSITLPNRIMISPMCMYSAVDGFASEYHLVHLGQYALGGAGLVFVEATAVQPHGRITHGDLGLWKDEQIEPLARIAEFLKAHGSIPAIQLAHAGRKASVQRPWEGDGPLTETETNRGELPWDVVGPTHQPFDDGWLKPHALTLAEMTEAKAAFVAAAERALRAGFEVIELHAAHGYLLNSFLSPLSNHRADEYGGSREARFRFPLEVAKALRECWPEEKPMFVRVSATDRAEGGVTIDDTVAFALALKALGVDVIDCSSGGVVPKGSGPEGFGYQVSFSEQVHTQAGIDTVAVGLIVDPQQAESILQQKRATFIAIARTALEDPYWPLHARQKLSEDGAPEFEHWPTQYEGWLRKRASTMTHLEPIGTHRDD